MEAAVFCLIVALVALGGTIDAAEFDFNRFVLLWGSLSVAFGVLSARLFREARSHGAERRLRHALEWCCQRLSGRMQVNEFTWPDGPEDYSLQLLASMPPRFRFEVTRPPELDHLVGFTDADLSAVIAGLPPGSASLDWLPQVGVKRSVAVTKSHIVVEIELPSHTRRREARDSLLGTIEALLPLHERLGETFVIPPKWLLEAVQGSDPAAARQAFAFLVDRYPHQRRGKQALEDGRKHADPVVRALAAQRLGSRGEELLRQLAVADAEDDPDAREAAAIALGALVERHPAEDIADVLRSCLRVEATRQLVALEAIAGLNRPEDVSAIGELTRAPSKQVQRAAVRALDAFGAAAQAELLDAIPHLDEGTCELLADRLAVYGTLEAVVPLKRIAETASVASLQAAAKAAIWSIQDRMGPVGAGRLALASEPEGAGGLSIVAASGGLSEPESDESAAASEPAEETSEPAVEATHHLEH